MSNANAPQIEATDDSGYRPLAAIVTEILSAMKWLKFETYRWPTRGRGKKAERFGTQSKLIYARR